MAFVQPQNDILMNSRYAGRYRFFTGRTEEPIDDSSPPYVVPFTVSILASQSLFLDQYYSPAATLIIPFIRKDIPFGYILIIFMQAVTALLVKWAFAPSPLYKPLLGNYQALPDFHALQQISALPQSPNAIKRPQRLLNLNNNNNNNNDDEVPSTPLLPEGITINLSFLAPFSAPTSRAASLFSIKLTLIKSNRGYLISVITLIIYFVIKPFLKKNNNTE